MAVHIRPYIAPDWESVCLVYDLAKPDELRGSVESSAILPLNADAEMKALFQDSEIHVAEQEGLVLGFVGTRGNFITWLFVHPAHRRQGVAANLLHHVLRRLHGVITLNVAKLNQPALRLYERLGFTTEREFVGNFNGQEIQAVKLRYERVA
jgi:ribosomal protein S18 acetylase RimI-like enzyme